MHRVSLNQPDLAVPLSRCPYVRSSRETPACVRTESWTAEAGEPPSAPFIVGLSHHTAHVGLRERFLADHVDRMLLDLLALGLPEAAVLFTCNRIEIYGVGGESAASAVREHLAARSGIEPDELHAHLYGARDLDAARHLMRVAAGLESLVLGESQILGQVAQALAQGRAAGAVGPELTRLFESAIRAGRRARAKSGLGRHLASISDAAVMLAAREHPDLAAAQVLVIGAGRMAALAIRALQARQARAIQLTSRSDQRAAALAGAMGAAAVPFARRRRAIAGADVVIAATAATVPIVDEHDLPSDGRRRLIIDLGVPRNVEAGVARIKGVELRSIDDLEQVVEQYREQRRGDVASAQRIIHEHVEAYRRDSAGRRMGPVIGALRQRVETLVDEEIRTAIRRLPRLDADSHAALEQMRRRIVGKLLHSPTMALKAHQNPQVSRLVSELFDLKAAGDAGIGGPGEGPNPPAAAPEPAPLPPGQPGRSR